MGKTLPQVLWGQETDRSLGSSAKESGFTVRLNIWEEKPEPQAVVHGVGNWTGCCSGQTGEEPKKSSELVFPEAEPYGKLWGSAARPAQGPRLPSVLAGCTPVKPAAVTPNCPRCGGGRLAGLTAAPKRRSGRCCREGLGRAGDGGHQHGGREASDPLDFISLTEG